MGPGAETAGGAGNGVEKATGSAYAFLVFMMVLNILNILDRQLLPTFGNEIKADLGLTN
ncbi:MAG: MFS transporter, partial [Phenylobacterium sp.]|nr:MFS transporter [Phenylobacterium sp.]